MNDKQYIIDPPLLQDIRILLNEVDFSKLDGAKMVAFCRLGMAIAKSAHAVERAAKKPLALHFYDDSFLGATYTSYGPRKLEVVKAVRRVTGCDLVTAKAAVESINKPAIGVAASTFVGWPTAEQTEELCRAMVAAGAGFVS